MTKAPRILIVGTGDTKADELLFMRDCIGKAGGVPVMMDASVLGEPPYRPDYDKHAVAAAAGLAAVSDRDFVDTTGAEVRRLRAQLFETKAGQAFMIEAETGTVLFSKEPDRPFPPASLAKLMTLEVVFSALKSGRLSLEDSFFVS
jgi:D-alanyl-D-alanine carboxypeptidase